MELWRLQSGFHSIPLPNPHSQVPTPHGRELQEPWQWKCHPQLWSQGRMDGDREMNTPGMAGMGRGAGKAGFERSPAQLGLCLARGKLQILSINIPRQTPDGSRTFPLSGKTAGKTKDPDWNRLSRDTNPSSFIWGHSSQVPAPAEGTRAGKEGL